MPKPWGGKGSRWKVPVSALTTVFSESNSILNRLMWQSESLLSDSQTPSSPGTQGLWKTLCAMSQAKGSKVLGCLGLTTSLRSLQGLGKLRHSVDTYSLYKRAKGQQSTQA